MDRIIISPSKYVQGNGALANIGNYVKALGAKPLILADAFVTKLVGDTVATSFHGAGIQPEFDCFNGECSRPEIDRLLARCKQTPFDVIIGIGGGKTLDTAKSVAFYQQVPVVIVPTIASTDAPTSALAVIYTPEGQFSEYLMIPTNPNMVIMDTGVVARAPVRLLVSGMGMRSPPTSRRAPTRCPVARPWPVAPQPWRRRPSPSSATRPCWPIVTRPSWRWSRGSAPRRWRTSSRPTPI